MTEATLKSALVKAIEDVMPGAEVFRLEDRFTAGVPDISNTWRKWTSWLEVKFADPSLHRSRAIQQLTMRRLAKHAYARYVIYEVRGDSKRTFIVHPDQLDAWRDSSIVFLGFDHRGVAEEVWRSHVKHEI